MNYRRLPLEGMRNARDLGGYPVSGGGVTRYRVFIRSDSPHRLTENDLSFLREYGVCTAIDFRGDPEISRKPSLFENASGFEYKRSPTFNSQVAFASRQGKEQGKPTMDSFVDWSEKYIEMLTDCRDWVRDTLRMMINIKSGVLFNCATGKDRTGIVSALLLSSVGVAREDAVADYCISELYLKEAYEELLEIYNKMWPEAKATINDPFFRTAPSNMINLLNHLLDTYGGVNEYLSSCGLSRDELKMLRDKFVEVE